MCLGQMAQALDEADFTMFSELGTNVVDSFLMRYLIAQKPALAGAGLAATTADYDLRKGITKQVTPIQSI